MRFYFNGLTLILNFNSDRIFMSLEFIKMRRRVIITVVNLNDTAMECGTIKSE